jgi:hypothetical protein
VKPRHLPPGTLRRLRLKWLALGVLLGAGLMVALAMYTAAIMPPELAYRSPVAAPRGGSGPASAPPAALALSPCAGQGKDCSALDAPTHTVPEPGALALVALGLVALATPRSHA